MSIELFNPKINPDNSLLGRVASAAKSFLGISRYETIYGKLVYPLNEGGTVSDPAKVILKDGGKIIIVRTSLYWGPSEFIDPLYAPDFANGRCIDLSDGDYKTVLADEDGQSSTVIKRYGAHTYWGDYAQERAETASEKLNRIYGVIMEICPQFILPTDRFVHQMPYYQKVRRLLQEGWAVFERQQRAIFISPWLTEEPKEAERIEKEAKSLSSRYHKKIAKELIRRGICQRDNDFLNVDLEELNFCLRYDYLTRTLVADDIIDSVHITDPKPSLR